MAFVVVETTYDPPLTDEQRRTEQARLDPCLELRGARWIQSFEAPDRRRKICLFQAPDAEAVREALRSSRIAFDRVWVTSWRLPTSEELAAASRDATPTRVKS
jgi:hypothetical protein